jgi:hypothetical protein
MTWENGCRMFLDSEVSTFMGAGSFDIEMTQKLHLEEKEDVIIYNHVFEDEIRYLIENALLAINCI